MAPFINSKGEIQQNASFVYAVKSFCYAVYLNIFLFFATLFNPTGNYKLASSRDRKDRASSSKAKGGGGGGGGWRGGGGGGSGGGGSMGDLNGPASFLIGVLYTSSIFDGLVLFGTGGAITEATIATVEHYYLSWWYGALAVKMFLHVVILAMFLSIVAKFARYTDLTFFFSGGSLALLIVNASLYISITIPYIRTLARHPSNPSLYPIFEPTDIFTRMQALFARGNNGPLGDVARANAAADALKAGLTAVERTEHISVLCAANTLAAVLLVGVIILQASEWYVDESVVKPMLEENAAVAVAPVTVEKKEQ